MVELPLMAEQPLCVFCRQHPADPLWRPFCSERCKIQDLARWADGKYRVAGDRVSHPEAERGETSDDRHGDDHRQ